MINNTPGSVCKRKRAVVVVPNKKFTIDIQNEDVCYAIIALHHPWRKEGEWLNSYATSVDAIKDIVIAGNSPLAVMLDRIQRMDTVTEDARLRHMAGYRENQSDPENSDSEHEEEAFYAHDNTTLDSPYEVGTSGFSTLHGYTSAQYESAQNFVKDQLAEWEQHRQERAGNLEEDVFSADMVGDVFDQLSDRIDKLNCEQKYEFVYLLILILIFEKGLLMM